MFAAHLIYLQSGCFGVGRTVCHACREHTGAQDRPFSRRSFPYKTVSLQESRNIQYFPRIDHQRGIVRFRLYRPLVFMPIRKRGLKHLGQCLFGITFHGRKGREFHLAQPHTGTHVCQLQPELACRRRRDRDNNRCIRVKADIQICIETVELELGQHPVSPVFFHP